MACFGYASEEMPNFVVWDLYTAQRERCITGDVANTAFEHFESRTEAVAKMICSAGSEFIQHGTIGPRVLGVTMDQKPLKLICSPKQDIAVLEVDMEGEI